MVYNEMQDFWYDGEVIAMLQTMGMNLGRAKWASAYFHQAMYFDMNLYRQVMSAGVYQYVFG